MENKISKSITFFSVFIFAVASVYLNTISFAAGLLATIVLAAWAKKLFSKRFSLVLMLVFAIGVVYTNWRTPTSDALQKYIFQKTQIQGTVISSPKYNNQKEKFYLTVKKIKGQKQISGRTAVSIFAKAPLKIQIGDEISLNGEFAAPHHAKNYGQFDYANYLKNQGIFTVFYAKDYKITGQNHSFGLRAQSFFDKTTEKIVSRHAKFLTEEQSDLFGGIVFGHKSVDLSDTIQQNFINSGVFHVLAASGMQIGLVLFFWYFVMRFFRIPYFVAMISGAIIIIIYAGFTGFPASIMRALLMAEFIIFGKLLDRQADSIALLLLVCSILILYNPTSIMDVGFQLSFITTFGILFCMPKILDTKIKFVPEFVSSTLILTIVAQIFSSPIIAYYFNNFSLYSLSTNLLIVPFVSIITFIGFTSSFVALVPHTTFLIKIVAFVLAPLLDGMNYLAAFFSSLPNSLLYIRQISALSVILSYVFIIFSVFMLEKSFKNKFFNTISIVSLVVLIALNINFSTSKKLEIVFFDVGNSDAILVKLPNQKRILVDTGKSNPYGASSGKTVIAEYLKAQGVKHLDAIILTHPDADHIGGCKDVIGAEDVDKVYQSDAKSKSKTYRDLEKALCHAKIDTATIKEGQTKILALSPQVKLKIFAPYGFEKNEKSLITYIEYKNFRALLMGDNEKEVMPFVAKKIAPPITVLKIGHHGSKDSIDSCMIKKLSPQNAVLCVGKNKFHHPDFSVTNLLEEKKVNTYRTDWDNMVSFSTDGKNTEIKRYREDSEKME